MALNQLSAMRVDKLSEPGAYQDGGGLFLKITNNGTKSWIYRYQLNGKRRDKGLGVYNKNTNSLSDARDAAEKARKLVADGIDPIEQAKVDKLQKAKELEQYQAEHEQEQATKLITFKVCAKDYIDTQSPSWKNKKHKSQWENTLRDYVYPIMGNLPINDVDITHVRKCLDPIWKTKTETASRVRGRIESVISSALATNRRDREKGNPAVWKGLLDNFYPSPEKVKKRKHLDAGTDGHFKALPYADMPDVMVRLVQLDGFGPLALRFLILTAVRTTELRLAQWDEIDLDKKIWTIPAGRMKASKQHRVALSNAAVELLEKTPKVSYANYIFPGWKKGSPMSDNGLSNVLRKRLGIDKTIATVHGFRSTFRDYIGEETSFPERIAEFALSHQLTDEAEKAYARGDKLKKRFDMMNAWANYCDSKTAPNEKVFSIGRRRIA